MMRFAGCAAFIGVLLLTPMWALLLMVAGNGLDARQGSWLFGVNGLCLLALAVAGPWLAARLARRWQPRAAPALAVMAALATTAVVVLLVLSVATLLTLAILTT
jgi:hypothetical protein